MTIPVIAFFNNKSGVGKTSMVYHLSWMFADRGLRVIATDLDPQSNLTASFLDEDRLEEIAGNCHAQSVFGAIKPLKDGTGDILAPHVEIISDRLGLIPGDMALSTFEDDLSEVWPKCLGGDARAFRVISAFWRIAQLAGQTHGADVILFDLGPNLGAINRASLIAADFIVIPLGPDLFSLQGLRNLGPAIRAWREGWIKRLNEKPPANLMLPLGKIQPIGYIVLRHTIRLDRPVKAFERWMARIPSTYAEAVLQQSAEAGLTMETDPNCIAKLKDYRSLMPLAQEARKPMFFLKPADGALGAHTYSVSDAYLDFKRVAIKIAQKRWTETAVVTDLPRQLERRFALDDASRDSGNWKAGQVELITGPVPVLIHKALEEKLLTRCPEEIFAAEDIVDWNEWVEFFSRTRESNGRRKGLVEVLL